MAQAIRRFRAVLGDTQHEFAARMGLTLTSIARYETNSQPSRTVLAKFAGMAQQANQPLFVEIFEGRIGPQLMEFEDQEISGAIGLLKSALHELGRGRHGYRRTKLLLTVHLLSPAKYAEAEGILEKLVPPSMLEEILNRAAGEFLRGCDPQIEQKRVEALRIAHQLVGTELDTLLNEIGRLANSQTEQVSLKAAHRKSTAGVKRQPKRARGDTETKTAHAPD